MDFVIIATTALLVAALTLVSGFGLGTVLMPAFAIFFPLEIAVAATGTASRAAGQVRPRRLLNLVDLFHNVAA